MSDNTNEQKQKDGAAEFSVKKVSPYFIDEVANISISPNGACRIQFATWQNETDGSPQRVDSEIIMTVQTMRRLSDALPKAMSQADKIMNKETSDTKPKALN